MVERYISNDVLRLPLGYEVCWRMVRRGLPRIDERIYMDRRMSGCMFMRRVYM